MNSLDRKITPGFLLKFTLPTVIMMVFNSFYTMVDGGFVSNFVGTAALSAVNIVYPLINLVFAAAIMLATGGSAVVAKQMGEKQMCIRDRTRSAHPPDKRRWLRTWRRRPLPGR